MSNSKEVREIFTSQFGSPLISLTATGRANIIGEHTDYYQGFVLPFAIDKAIYFCAAFGENENKIISADFNQTYREEDAHFKGNWQNFIYNLLQLLDKKYHPNQYVNIVFGGDLPIGAGLSSSSALCCGFIEIFDRLFHLNLTNYEKIDLASEIEHGSGVKGGKMDQYSIYFGEELGALLLDCGKMTHTTVKVPHDWKFLLINTGVKHNLAHTAYNQRRQEGENALQKIMEIAPTVSSYLNVDLTILEKAKPILTDKEYNRAFHVITENKRVHDFAYAMVNGEIEKCGKLMSDSHHSLSKLYEVSCDELDELQTLAAEKSFIYGSRMMGGGFGGCTINLIKDLEVKALDDILSAYHQKYAHKAEWYLVQSKSGIAPNA